ncbi:hypothetical protein PUL85_001816 [Campylobacter jejuni]|nr:hypothetical protein [Campylobacter jejuni]
MHVENNLSPEDRQGIENYLIILNTISFLGDLNIKYNNHNAKIKNYYSGYCKYYCKIA